MIRPSIECWLIRVMPTGPEMLLLHAPEAPGRRPELWQPVSGGIEADEAAEDACVRETREETGLSITPDDLTCVLREVFFVVRPDLTLHKSVFWAPAPGDVIAVDPNEHDTYAWTPVDQVHARLVWESHHTTWAAVLTSLSEMGVVEAH
jgi:8-oxo-dGTP pyrophosphatase MutT (NUDIX family)